MSIANEITRIQNAKSRLISILSEHVSLTGNENINELVELAKQIGIEGVSIVNGKLTISDTNMPIQISGSDEEIEIKYSTKTQKIKIGTYSDVSLSDESLYNVISAPNLESQNIKKDVNILGVVGTFEGGTNTSDATATANDILLGKTAYVNDEKIEGLIETYDYSFDEGGNSADTLEQFFSNTLTSVYSETATEITDFMFKSKTNLESIDFPNVTKIKQYAFQDCENLKTLNLPLVNYIDMYAFQRCALENIYLPSLTSCNGSAFSSCTALISADLPLLTSVRDIFVSCTTLTTVKLASATAFTSTTFFKCSALTDVYLGANQVVTLSDTMCFYKVPSGCRIHVRPEYADQYATATNWSSFIADGTIVIVGDYSD